MIEIRQTAAEACDPVAVAIKAYEAYVAKDRSIIEQLIADDFHFTSPLDNRIDRQLYFERCWPNSRSASEFKIIYVVQDADRVFVTYEGRADNGKTFRNTEVLTIRHGKIVEVEVYFGWSLPHEALPGSFLSEP
jgi:ketosteroid isomerase-like protein